jgi:hypothetical protein
MQQRPEFPSVADLPNLAQEDAWHALAVLRTLVESGLADVYSSAGSNDARWNVWSNIRWCRIPLREWAADLMQHLTPPEGDAA